MICGNSGILLVNFANVCAVLIEARIEPIFVICHCGWLSGVNIRLFHRLVFNPLQTTLEMSGIIALWRRAIALFYKFTVPIGKTSRIMLTLLMLLLEIR